MQIWDESKCASPVNGERNKPFMTHYVCAARRLQAHYRSHATPGALQTGSCIGIVFTPKRKVKVWFYSSSMTAFVGMLMVF